MKCEDFEALMADALGDELSPGDRPAFEAHLAECDRCRREYESSRKTIATMRSLPGPRQVSVKREGNRLVIEDTPAAGSARAVASRGLRPLTYAMGGVFRYAASVLIAFAGGYALHAGLMAADASRQAAQLAEAPPDRDEATGRRPGGSLQSALVSAYAGNPARSDLAKCLAAVTRTGS